MGKTLALYGKEKADIAYFLAKSLASNDFLVAIIDNSYSKDLFDSINQKESDENFIEKENIIYLKDALVDEDFTNKFDFVLFYQGSNETVVKSDYSFVITDYTKPLISDVKRLSDDIKDKSYFIFRDKVTGKITEANISRELDISKDKILGYLPLNLKDEVTYQGFTYTGRGRLKETSSDMKYAVMTLVSIVTGDDLKTVRKYYRKAKRNKRF